MPIPRFPDKYTSRSIVTPQLTIKHLLKNELKGFVAPKYIFICYKRSLLNFIKKKYQVQKFTMISVDLYLIDGAQIGFLTNLGIGAPMMGMIAEILIALGVENIISIGTAGSLNSELKVGDLVLVRQAIRDDGTSHHYIKGNNSISASRDLLKIIRKQLNDNSILHTEGITWTTDAPYRETEKEVLFYQNQSVLCVEMEISTLFTIAKFYNVRAAAIVAISDSLANLVWEQDFQNPLISSNLEYVLKCLTNLISW